MEFPFAISEVLPNKLTKVSSSLLPENYSGDRRNAGHTASRISDILDEMGVASAKAQDLKKPITSGEKMRASDHVIYILTDDDGKSGNGSVVGLLKIGYKKLYLFDSLGLRHEVESLCILDFYVHESKQRMGCGKILYELMLKDANIKPHHLAIDRPSEKFLHFLYKHYGLKTILPQSNHYVVFSEFFSDAGENGNDHGKNGTSMQVPTKPRVLASYPAFDANGMTTSCNGLQSENYGRHAASKPICSMGKILHNPNANAVNVPRTPSRSASLTGSIPCGFEENVASGPASLLDEEVTKNLFLHSRLW